MTQVLKFDSNPGEISQVAPQGVSGLNRTVQLGLETMSMINRIILVGVGQASERCRKAGDQTSMVFDASMVDIDVRPSICV